MSLIHDIPAERLARLFHHYQEVLSNQFHELEKCGTAVDEMLIPWEQTPEAERKLLIAAAQLSLMELDSLRRDVIMVPKSSVDNPAFPPILTLPKLGFPPDLYEFFMNFLRKP